MWVDDTRLLSISLLWISWGWETSGEIVRDPEVWGLIKGKGYGHKGAVAHTQDQGHFEVRFAWGSFTKQESIQRLLPWAAPQGQKGKRTAEEKRDLGLVAQQLAESGSRSSEG